MSTDIVQTLLVARHGTPSLISTHRVLRSTCSQPWLPAFGRSSD